MKAIAAGDRLGRYEILGLLGRGGMGAVYRARDAASQSLVALKVLPADVDLDPRSAERFAQEAAVLGGLDHPGLVKLRGGLEREGGLAFYAMELVEGQSLAQVLRARGRLRPDEAVAVGVRILDALAAAHARGVVHRDVKPSNVLVERGGAIRVVDFGLARALDATRLTRSGERMGTPSYMSPEQADGQPAGPASDLYSTAALLYECVAGRPPFEAESPLAVLLKHMHEEPPPLAVPGTVEGLEAAIRRGLAKREGDRFPSAAAFAEALRATGLEEEGERALAALCGEAATGSWPLAAGGAPAAGAAPPTATEGGKGGAPSADALDSEAPTLPAGGASTGQSSSPRRRRPPRSLYFAGLVTLAAASVLAVLTAPEAITGWLGRRVETPSASPVGVDLRDHGSTPVAGATASTADAPPEERSAAEGEARRAVVVETVSDGDLTGTLVRIDEDEVVLDTGEGVLRSHPRADVRRIRYADAAR